MLILKTGSRHRELFPATTSMAAVLPLAVSLPALSVLFGDRLGALATAALVVAGLVLIACTAGLAGRAARESAERARRDEAVLDALEPLAGLDR
ncbi:hypothetical protein ACIRBY_25585 [Streptomyces sp. NPDC096136]|uniref:hypothetical protein n=1 Tax=Streptomyces sp. NPDC096136 TaxID=3366076 RepID=UPI00381EB86E